MSKHTTKTRAMSIPTPKHIIAEDGTRLARSAPIKIPVSNRYFNDYLNTGEGEGEDDSFFVGSYKDYIKNKERQTNWLAIYKLLNTTREVDADEEIFTRGETEDETTS